MLLEERREGGGVDVWLGGLQAQFVQERRVPGEWLGTLVVVELNVS